jgi:hypothetical protein
MMEHAMDGNVAPILWYLFWVVVAGAMIAGVFIGGHKAHHQRMTALNILKSYAEKGTEPPAAMVDLLMETSEAQRAARSTEQATARASQPTGWLGLVFMAGVAAGLAWWRIDAGGPQWAIYVAVTCAVVLGIGAFGTLVATLVTTLATLAARGR